MSAKGTDIIIALLDLLASMGQLTSHPSESNFGEKHHWGLGKKQQ